MAASSEFPRVVRKYRLGEEPKDCEYWLTLSMKERLDSLIDLINRHHGWTDETAPRLERVLTIIKRDGIPNREDLKKNKLATGRPRDLADIDDLGFDVPSQSK